MTPAKDRAKAWREERRAAGLCARCGKVRVAGTVYAACARCRALSAALYTRRRSEERCYRCGLASVAGTGQTACPSCREALAAKRARAKQERHA